MPKVRLCAQGMDTYTAMFGVVEFKDGVSVDHVSMSEIRLLGAVTQIAVIDDEGNEHQGGPAYEAFLARSKELKVEEKLVAVDPNYTPPSEIIPAPVSPVSAQKTDDKDADIKDLEEQLDEPKNEGQGDEPKNEGQGDEQKPVVHTREQLEAIADEHGIKGLREIAEPMNIRGTSIQGLIAEILKVRA